MIAVSRIIAVAALMFFAASSVAAQASRPERPYRGLFASGIGDAEQSLVISFQLGAGYDDNILADEGISQDMRRAKPGSFGTASAGLAWSYNTPRVTAGAAAGTSARLRRGNSFADTIYAGHSASASLATSLWRGSRVSVGQSVAYQPYFVFRLLPSLDDETLAPSIDEAHEFAVTGDDTLSYGTRAGWSQRLSRRGSLAVGYGRYATDFGGGRADFTSQSASAHYRHSLAQGLGARAGYTRRISDSDAEGRSSVRVHSIDAGIDYNRALSFSRRTTLSFATGTSAVSDAVDTRYHVTGSAHLVHEIGRTWAAALAYNRSVQFIDVFHEATLADAAVASVNGMFSRQLGFHSMAGITFAHPGQRSRRSDFDTYLATAGVSYGITRNLAVGVDYSFYRYAFAAQAELPAGFSRTMNRQSVRAYLSLWAPLVHVVRRPDAAR